MSNNDEWITVTPVKSDETHDFNKVAELQGVYIKMDSNVGANNSNIYTVKTKDGKIVSFWGSTVIDARMEQVELGVFLKVVYKGMTKSEKTGRSYKDFEIMYKRQPQKPSKPVSEELNVDDVPF